MSAFRFPLQKVLEYREQAERERAKGLAAARAKSDEAQRARADLEALRDAGRSRLMRAHGSGRTVGHLQNMALVLDQVDEQIENAQAACQQADEQVVENLKSYHEAIQQRKTIDQLRERRLDQWKAEEQQRERKAMDEIAITRHARSDRTSAMGG